MNFTISDGIKSQLENVIADSPGTTVGNAGKANGGRQVLHVTVTSGADGLGLYECNPRSYSPVDDAWTDYEPALCFEVNGAALESGQIYLGVRYGFLGGGGYDSTKLVFACQVSGGTSWRLMRVTGGSGNAYTGEIIELDDYSGEYVDVGISVTGAYRSPSSDYDETSGYLPVITSGQTVLVRRIADDLWEMSSWGSQKRQVRKVFRGSYCDAGNIVNVYSVHYLHARDLCWAPAPTSEVE